MFFFEPTPLTDTFGVWAVTRALEMAKADGAVPESNLMQYILRALEEARAAEGKSGG